MVKLFLYIKKKKKKNIFTSLRGPACQSQSEHQLSISSTIANCFTASEFLSQFG